MLPVTDQMTEISLHAVAIDIVKNRKRGSSPHRGEEKAHIKVEHRERGENLIDEA